MIVLELQRIKNSHNGFCSWLEATERQVNCRQISRKYLIWRTERKVEKKKHKQGFSDLGKRRKQSSIGAIRFSIKRGENNAEKTQWDEYPLIQLKHQAVGLRYLTNQTRIKKKQWKSHLGTLFQCISVATTKYVRPHSL